VIVWDDGDPLLAEPFSPGIHARDAALVRQELEESALVRRAHRTTDVERLVQLGWSAMSPRHRRESPSVVLSATREGESRGQRVPSAAFAAARAALETGPVLVQVAPRLRARARVRPVPHAGALSALHRSATRAPSWRGAGLHVVRSHDRRGPADTVESTTLRMASSGASARRTSWAGRFRTPASSSPTAITR
jgi:hypothetical protein